MSHIIAFTNTSSGALNYSWDFGDGSGSISTNPTHTYTGNGPYTVSLTAINPVGSDIYTDVLDFTTPVPSGTTDFSWVMQTVIASSTPA